MNATLEALRTRLAEQGITAQSPATLDEEGEQIAAEERWA